VLPYARAALARGLESGRLRARDPELALTAIVSASLGMLRAIIDGRHGEDADVAFAEFVLCSLGLPPEEAHAISAAARPPAG
jgi:hypothetical protein